MIDKIFEQDYHALTLKDILQARDFYHVYLMNMKNVVGTAVGRYLIRHDDPWPTPDNPSLKFKEKNKHPGKKFKKPRTLEYSEIRPYSWPCILVFIRNWEKEKSLLINGNNNVIPKHLNLPDGRTVPVCRDYEKPEIKSSALREHRHERHEWRDADKKGTECKGMG